MNSFFVWYTEYMNISKLLTTMFLLLPILAFAEFGAVANSWGLVIITFIIIAGFIIGLGSVTVIDLHGFLGRKSSYWTLATTRTHKVTKPLIWIGTGLVIIGLLLYGWQFGVSRHLFMLLSIFAILILNGLFLTFGVSRFLLQRERQGRDAELLPKKWQDKITISFVISFLGWWLSLFMFIYQLLM